jgi:hypothetical protein
VSVALSVVASTSMLKRSKRARGRYAERSTSSSGSLPPGETVHFGRALR